MKESAIQEDVAKASLNETQKEETKPFSDNETREADRVPIKEKAAFAGGIVCGAMGYNGIQMIGKPVLNIIFGMSPALIGVVLASMRLWDGLLDPIMGRISDNSRTRWGRRRPYIFVGAILTSLTFPLIWLMDPEWSNTAKTLYLIVTCMLFYACFTVFSVPYATLSTELTPDYSERSRVRAAISIAGTFVFAAYGWVFAATQQGWMDSPVASMRAIGVVLAVVMVVFGVLSAIVPQERFYEISKKQEKVAILPSFKTFLRDPVYLKLAGIGLGIILGNNIIDFLAQYVALFYVFKGELKSGSMFVAMNVTLTKAFELLAIWLLSKYFANVDKRKVLIFTVVATFIGTLSKWFLLDPNYPYLFFLTGVYMAPASAGFWMIYSSMQADFPDYDEHKTGLRREGVLSALNGWIIKVGVAIALAGSGVVLSMTGFDRSLEGDQSDLTFLLMRINLIAIPCCFYLLTAWCILKYPIGVREMLKIRQELEARR